MTTADIHVIRADVLADLGVFESRSALLATTLTFSVGAVLTTLDDGVSYEVAAAASDLQTAGGNHLTIRPIGGGNWDVTSFGAVGDGTTDDSTAIQAAIDAAFAAGGGTVTFPVGDYGIASTLDLKDNVTLSGAGFDNVEYSVTSAQGASLQALAGCSTMIACVSTETYMRGGSVRGLHIDGNSIASIGINITDTVQFTVEGCWFARMASAGSAIYGGGVLYVTVHQNSFQSGDYYAYNSQDAYTTLNVYYGTNVGEFSLNNVNANYGFLCEGIMNVTSNAFEVTVKSLAAVHFNGAQFNSYCSIQNNYFELARDTTPETTAEFVAIRGKSMAGGIKDNRVYGQAGYGTAIQLDEGYNLGVSIEGNTLVRWDTGIAMKAPGHDSATVNHVYDIGANTFDNVTNPITNAAGAVTAAASMAGKQGSRRVQYPKHHEMIGGLYQGSVNINYAATTLDLQDGNLFRYIYAGSVTVSTVDNADAGSRFSVIAASGSTITLADSAFNLSCGADFVLPTDVPLLFEVDAGGTVREVGRTSALHSTATAPSDTTTPVAWAEIAPGYRVPLYQ